MATDEEIIQRANAVTAAKAAVADAEAAFQNVVESHASVRAEEDDAREVLNAARRNLADAQRAFDEATG